MRVLILGGRAPVALDHARRFASQGWTAFIGDSLPARLSGWSRSVTRTFRLPPPRDALSAFATELNAIIQRERIDLLLPTCEEVFFVSRVRASATEFLHCVCSAVRAAAAASQQVDLPRVGAGM